MIPKPGERWTDGEATVLVVAVARRAQSQERVVVYRQDEETLFVPLWWFVGVVSDPWGNRIPRYSLSPNSS